MCYSHVNFSLVIFPIHYQKILIAGLNVVELPPKVAKRITFEEQVTDININRL
jgi:hypothetical protein